MTMTPQDILTLDAHGISTALEKGELTAVELMEFTLDRIGRINPLVGDAIVLLRDRTELLEEAAQADSSLRKGWLHGIPIAIKDLSNCQGIPTTMGGSLLPLFQDFVPLSSDPFVQRLIDAGAIVIGKTNTPEGGLGSHTYSRLGRTCNPYDLSKSAGGSSGGAAVAVVTRMLALADGSDMMGSLRNPAGWNNLYSIRPTAGMMEYDETARNPLDYPISTVGPIARTVQDLAQCLETMAGSDKFKAVDATEYGEISGLKVAWLGDWAGNLPVEDGILPLCREALGVLATASGVEVHDIEQPLFPASQLWKAWTTIRSAVISSATIAAHGEKAILKSCVPGAVRPELKWEVERGLSISDDSLAEAGTIAREWSTLLEDLFANKYDVIALPSAQLWPFPAEWDWPKEVAGKPMDSYHRWMEVVVPVSLAGLPCVTVPAGFGANGLPIGIQLAGRRGEDAKLLRLAQAYHEAVDWPSKQPAVVDDVLVGAQPSVGVESSV
jgi:amidase